jgi:hypothetical protein
MQVLDSFQVMLRWCKTEIEERNELFKLVLISKAFNACVGLE